MDSFTVCNFSPFLSIGYNCQVNIDECASNPCLNQGTCFDDVSGYTCQCALPYTGGCRRCQQCRCVCVFVWCQCVCRSLRDSGLWFDGIVLCAWGTGATLGTHYLAVLPVLADCIWSFEKMLWWRNTFTRFILWNLNIFLKNYVQVKPITQIVVSTLTGMDHVPINFSISLNFSNAATIYW